MADAEVDVAGCCGPCIAASLQSWCILHPFGAEGRCCGGPRGCCGSCCDSSFNKDNFDERMKKEQAREGTNPKPVDSQLAPSDGMPLPTNSEA